jgi:CRP-like cAMP-binding protein
VTIETLERILAEHPFFDGMSQAHLDTLVGCAKNVTFETGQFLFRTGQAADSFFVIRHGRVAVECASAGRGPLTIETVADGDVLGWSWLFPPYRWHFDARAGSFVRAFALDAACLRGKCEKDPGLGFDLLQRFATVVVQRLEATQMQLMDVYGDVPRRR